jgi:hypothetical protein
MDSALERDFSTACDSAMRDYLREPVGLKPGCLDPAELTDYEQARLREIFRAGGFEIDRFNLEHSELGYRLVPIGLKRGARHIR